MNARKELKYMWKWLRGWANFGPHYLLMNRPVVWMNNDGTVHEVEHWSRRSKLKILRPRYDGLHKKLPCGCTARFGKVILFARRPMCTVGHTYKNNRANLKRL